MHIETWFWVQIQFLSITLKLLVLETVLFQGQTDDLFKVYVILVSGAGESMIRSFILVISWCNLFMAALSHAFSLLSLPFLCLKSSKVGTDVDRVAIGWPDVGVEAPPPIDETIFWE